jgi:mannonate dehydratase
VKLSFRWYGESDPVPLRKIRQIPAMRGIVGALYDVEPGAAWERGAIAALDESVRAEGLELAAIESVPVHEDVKLGLPTRDRYLEAWMETVRRIGERGIGVVIYNFMPVFDWTRSALDKRNPDGSRSLAYDPGELAAMDPSSGELALPGWIGRYEPHELSRLIAMWRESGVERLWSAFEYFIKAVAPVAAEAGVRLALHPDDPPWAVFGIPRAFTGARSLARAFALESSPANGLCFCSGSLAASEDNDPVALASEFAPRVAFAHLRNVAVRPGGYFEETAHWSRAGSIDQYGVIRALHRGGFTGWVRPDHGRMIWDEEGKPGYGLFDRALGSQYLLGLIEAVEREGA